MNIAHCFTRPYFVYRPGQIWRRLAFEWKEPAGGREWVKLPWNLRLRVHRADDIGQALATTGVNDLLVSEALFRLLNRGDFAVDVGANIGYMTSIMARGVGSEGRVIAFEPHPEIYQELYEHVDLWERDGEVKPGVVETVNLAISNQPGEVTLVEPATFEGNRGRSALERDGSPEAPKDGLSAGHHCTRADTLDRVFADPQRIGVLKIDVEGHEEMVLKGATQLLRDRRIRDVIFEEFAAYPAPTHRLLESHGFQIFVLEERLRGPCLRGAGEKWQMPRYAPPNYLATIDPARLRRRFEAGGWQCLK